MPSGLKRFQKAESLHFITFSCFHRLPLLETPGAWETSSASRPNKVRTGHPISRGNACRLEIGWATRPSITPGYARRPDDWYWTHDPGLLVPKECRR
jgi:hypothetical protein